MKYKIDLVTISVTGGKKPPPRNESKLTKKR